MSEVKKIVIDDIKTPPAIEAIIELRFPPPEEKVSIGLISGLTKEFEADFPVVKNYYTYMAHFEMGKNLPSPQHLNESRQIGYNLQSSEDGDCQTIWFHLDKILVSNVGKYCGGDKLISLFKRALSSYLKATGYVKADRLAMRYINRVNYSPESLSKKVSMVPALPDIGAKILINEMMLGSAVADDLLQNKANLNYFFKSIDDGSIQFILDIDAYFQGEIDTKNVDFVDARLKSIRDFKNKFFLNSFTQEGLEDFL